jgi:mannose/fructose/N-acetylgalactosamine-specific phosphotransferase system component IIC
MSLAEIDHFLFFHSTLIVAFGGGLCALDRTAVFQGMFSRPLVAGLLSGILAGNWEIGLLLGVVLELYYLNELPVGTNIPTDDTLLALAAGGVGGVLRGLPAFVAWDDRALALVVLLTILPWAGLTRKLDAWVRERNQLLVEEAETALLAGRNLPAIDFHLYGFLNFYFAAVVGLVVIMAVSLGIGWLLLRLLPLGLEPLLAHLLIVFPLFGIAGLLSGMNKKRLLAVFAGTAFCLLLV